jgi:probable DNA metabolism protein
MRIGLAALFALLDSNENPDYHRESAAELSLQEDIAILMRLHSGSFDPSLLGETARRFYELSVNAFDAFVYAWMSELPIEDAILSYGRRVIAAAQRRAAEMAALDRGREDTLLVLSEGGKVQHEIHRLLGLLRFSPDAQGMYIARCQPDYLALPALGEHFTVRFGETAWAIIDEKRGLTLSRRPGERVTIQSQPGSVASSKDEWEELWRHYHKTINNESRNNPNLQRQFMPKRYWKYLPEM